MANPSTSINKTPWAFIISTLVALLFLGLKQAGVDFGSSIPIVILEVLLLGFAVFGAVHHAEILALKVGEPYGSIILALAVTVIEAALIISQMSTGKPGVEVIGRDAVFATVMIVLNGIVGLALLMGGARFHVQRFKLDGAAAALSVLATLAALSLILPNFTTTAPGPVYSSPQLAFVGTISLVLYAIFVFVQTVRHHDYFVTGEKNAVNIPLHRRAVTLALIFLPLSLVAVVLMAKALSGPIDAAIAAAGLPTAVLGVVIAFIVLLPESIASLRAARVNDLQTSLNLALGSAIATIGLTIPTLAAYSLWHGDKLSLGISPQSTALLVLTLFISSVTLATGRTTILQGAVHLVIFGAFLFLTAWP
ncbi:calcium:proton antiporter [Aestuariivirga litoralis]|uniref:calcium:proton antiporter n=1 Tax=Aestuariivirga litoralis TaxID=2650924 RepID=UPI0018C5F1A2|nr:ionic transporter y4hA [Aestuariivirga litoralis]MBG1233603.1 ionic transporter y4hA [Aestuariivirga litoralis]